MKRYTTLKFTAMLVAWSLFGLSPAAALTVNIITNTGAGDTGQQLVSSAPYDNQVLDKPPSVITLTFAQPVRPDKSSIKVLDMYGTRIDGGVLEADGLKLSVQLPDLAPGRYSVRWSARCRCDADSDIGDAFHFTVR